MGSLSAGRRLCQGIAPALARSCTRSPVRGTNRICASRRARSRHSGLFALLSNLAIPMDGLFEVPGNSEPSLITDGKIVCGIRVTLISGFAKPLGRLGGCIVKGDDPLCRAVSRRNDSRRLFPPREGALASRAVTGVTAAYDARHQHHKSLRGRITARADAVLACAYPEGLLYENERFSEPALADGAFQLHVAIRCSSICHRNVSFSECAHFGVGRLAQSAGRGSRCERPKCGTRSKSLDPSGRGGIQSSDGQRNWALRAGSVRLL
jgi:hypothetical protein